MPRRRSVTFDGAAGLQVPGVEASIQAEGGAEIVFEDPRVIVADLCELADQKDPGTDPWPHDGDGEPIEYIKAENAEAIAEELIERVHRFGYLRRFEVHYLFRRAETWEKNGKTVLGEMKKPSGLLKNYSGADFVVLLNWFVWLALNPMQRVALVYHELRHGSYEDGKPRLLPHDFEGFLDELQIFGTRTYEDWNRLAASVSEGSDVTHQFSLGLLD